MSESQSPAIHIGIIEKEMQYLKESFDSLREDMSDIKKKLDSVLEVRKDVTYLERRVAQLERLWRGVISFIGLGVGGALLKTIGLF